MAIVIPQDEYFRETLAEEIDFGQALRIIKGFMDTDDTLDALMGFEKRYLQEIEVEDENPYFQEEYRYEIFSYNLLVEGFGKLFAPKEVA